MIDYTAEARNINELVSMEDRENAYASLASRLRAERDELQRRLDNMHTIAEGHTP